MTNQTNAINRYDAVLAGVLVLLVVIFASPLLYHPSRGSVDDDWLLHFSYHTLVKTSLVQHGELPIWSPYFGGGYPIAGHPELPFPALSLLCTLPFGEILGLKLFAIVIFVGAALGMYFFCRRVAGFDEWSAAFCAVLFCVGTWIPMRLKGGNISEAYFAWLPLLVLCYRESQRRLIWLLLTAILLAIFFKGKLVFANSLLFVGLLALMDSFVSENNRRVFRPAPLIRLGLAVSVALLLCMVKLLPLLVLLKSHDPPGIYEAATISKYSLHKLITTLVPQGLSLHPTRPSYIFVGIGPAILVVTALALRLRYHLRWLVLLIIFSMLTLGSNALPDLFRIIWHLPIFGAIQRPGKWFNFFVYFLVCVLAGGGVYELRRRLNERAFSIVLAIAAVFCLIPLGQMNYGLLNNIFDKELPVPQSEREFYQVEGIGLTRNKPRTYHSNQYFNVQRGIGTTDWYSSTGFARPSFAIPRYYVDLRDRLHSNPAYRGEAWLASGSGKARLVSLGMSYLVIEATTTGPDTLVVNQNYDSSWQWSAGEVQSADGLLSVRLAKPGKHRVTLEYYPKVFYIRLFVSALSLATILILIAVTLRRKWTWTRFHRAITCERISLRIPRPYFTLLVTAVVVAGLVFVIVPGAKRSKQKHEADRQVRKAISEPDKPGKERRYRNAIELFPQHPEAHLHLAQVYFERKQYEDAIAELHEVIKVQPRNAAAHNSLGITFLEQGKEDMALAALLRAKELHPAMWQTHEALATIYHRRGDSFLANLHAQTARDLNPTLRNN